MKRMKRGFTLVEIMIVVAIIGILVGIAVPGFIKARKMAQGKSCNENLAKIDGAKEQYALDWNLTTGGTASIALLCAPDSSGVAGTGYLKKTPFCPSGGTYTEGDIGTDPTCDIADKGTAPNLIHTLP